MTVKISEYAVKASPDNVSKFNCLSARFGRHEGVKMTFSLHRPKKVNENNANRLKIVKPYGERWHLHRPEGSAGAVGAPKPPVKFNPVFLAADKLSARWLRGAPASDPSFRGVLRR